MCLSRWLLPPSIARPVPPRPFPAFGPRAGFPCGERRSRLRPRGRRRAESHYGVGAMFAQGAPAIRLQNQDSPVLAMSTRAGLDRCTARGSLASRRESWCWATSLRKQPMATAYSRPSACNLRSNASSWMLKRRAVSVVMRPSLARRNRLWSMVRMPAAPFAASTESIW